MAYKQVILVRTDIKIPTGKLAVQVAHASVAAADKAKGFFKRAMVKTWKMAGAKKVVLKVADVEELKKYHRLAKKSKIASALIQDAGRTVFKGSTITCVGIGPDKEDKIDKITGKLKML